jgi:hypothetical protein
MAQFLLSTNVRHQVFTICKKTYEGPRCVWNERDTDGFGVLEGQFKAYGVVFKHEHDGE